MMRFHGMILVLVCAVATGQAAIRDLNPVRLHEAPAHPPVVLVTKGQPQGVIVLATQGRRVARAVAELQRYIREATGAELPIVKEAAGKPVILVGACPQAEAAGLVAAEMPVEGFSIQTGPGVVYLVGHDEAGTLWAVDEFLERFVDVRWYWPETRGDAELVGTSVPKRNDLSIAPVHLSDAPAFRKRHRYPSGGGRVAKVLMGDHDRHLRAHDSWPIKLLVHAPHGWDSFYQVSRPEIFQLRSDGERDFGMLCYGNPLTLQTYLEEIAAQRDLAAKGQRPEPGRGILNGNTITVSPADMAVSCSCEHCRALWNDAGGSYGTASRVLGEFVANLARQVKVRWPEMTVIFLPYKNYTYAPEGVTFPDNVEIQICGMPGLAQHKDTEINTAEQANIDKWVQLSGCKIQNWHYSCWPANRTQAAYLFPHTIQAHYRANRDKTVGSFINGVGDHWPRQHVSLYVWLKVLWNPEFNVDAAIDAYCLRMYGPAAGTLRELVGMQIRGWEEREWPNHMLSPKSLYEVSYPRADVLKMEALLEVAYSQAADDALVTKRLDYVAAPLRAFFAESKQYVDGSGIKTLQAFQVAEVPVIDGQLDEAGWSTIEPLTLVRATNRENPEAKFPTQIKAVWTHHGVTFGFRMHEPEPATLMRDIKADSRDASQIWWNDNVEIFLDVKGERSGYYQFIVNANGSLFDSKGADVSWNSQGVKAATFVGEDFWTLEVFLPIATFEDAVPPGTGVEWYANFTRHRVNDRKNREYQRLNTTFSGPSNDQNAFGPLRFIER